MKTIIQLLIAALLVYACVRAGESAWRHYQFENLVEQEARFGDMRTTSELRRRLLQLAEDYGIALDEGDLIVRRRGQETVVSLTYVEAIPLLPKMYTHQQTYEITMSVQPV